ncbi:MAG: tRNA threonylcarbamoyladenosine biosynthesis protein TsaE [Actinomycetota bacterium]|jgi:tRNA threonylcarbamoyladenosine biosynthesis protein TsaE|nr:tRNA threonylcarbamoyladenosine biosynthesis protein TsaE [Actinomycetota bacterium]
MKTTTTSADHTRALGAALGAVLRPGDVVLLAGDLGAGKTTFAQGVAAALGIDGPVTSPTFTIVHEYDGRIPLVHVDVYRLETLAELHDLGFEEIVDDARVTLVEWGDMVAQALPTDRLLVRLELVVDDDERFVTFVPHGARWRERMGTLERAVSALGNG